ncbi:unnamed protein product [Timema podura]|uniref:Dynein regulatory complex subunit 2 n=1 Tax=Timema podura TaxID=61482 RepID=A0ABN7NXP7_TIMPD|nr:unnamed protein product [Timema podura]
MGPKKKGKGSKLARMTEEEKARYLQHRAAIEEEARRRKQQLIATFMKNKLKKEEAFTRLNLAKINQQWRQILRGIKSQELRRELEGMIRTVLAYQPKYLLTHSGSLGVESLAHIPLLTVYGQVEVRISAR